MDQKDTGNDLIEVYNLWHVTSAERLRVFGLSRAELSKDFVYAYLKRIHSYPEAFATDLGFELESTLAALLRTSSYPEPVKSVTEADVARLPESLRDAARKSEYSWRHQHTTIPVEDATQLARQIAIERGEPIVKANLFIHTLLSSQCEARDILIRISSEARLNAAIQGLAFAGANEVYLRTKR